MLRNEARRSSAFTERTTMEHAPVKIFTSREFVRNVNSAKRAAAEGAHVIVTDRGKSTVVLLSIAEYRRLTTPQQNLVDLLRMPEADAFEFDSWGSKDLS